MNINKMCQYCGKALNDEGEFCSECGKKNEPELTLYCENCGCLIDEDNSFCENCGAPLKQCDDIQTMIGTTNNLSPKRDRLFGKIVKRITILLLIVVFFIGIGASIYYEVIDFQSLKEFVRSVGLELVEQEDEVDTAEEVDTVSEVDMAGVENTDEVIVKKIEEQAVETEESEILEDSAVMIVPEEEKEISTIVMETGISYTMASSYLVEYFDETGIIMHNAELTLDGDVSTAWSEDVELEGVGEWLQYVFDDSYTINGIEIYGGYGKSETQYYKNNRLKDIKIYFSDGTVIEYTLSDDYGVFHIIELDAEVISEYVKIEIVSVYKGNTYDDTCISEVAFY